MISFLRLALYLHLLLHGVDSLELLSKQKLQYNTKSKPSGCLSVAKDGDEVRIEWSVSDADSKVGTLTLSLSIILPKKPNLTNHPSRSPSIPTANTNTNMELKGKVQ